MLINNQLLSLKEVVQVTTLSKSSIRRYEQKGVFPKRIPLGGNRIAWRNADIQKWCKEPTTYRSK